MDQQNSHFLFYFIFEGKEEEKPALILWINSFFFIQIHENINKQNLYFLLSCKGKTLQYFLSFSLNWQKQEENKTSFLYFLKEEKLCKISWINSFFFSFHQWNFCKQSRVDRKFESGDLCPNSLRNSIKKATFFQNGRNTLFLNLIYQNYKFRNISSWKNFSIQYSVVVEYTNCVSTNGQDPHPPPLQYDTKPSNGKTSDLDLWRMWSTHLLPLFSASLWPGLVVSIMIPDVGEIKISNHFLYLKAFRC